MYASSNTGIRLLPLMIILRDGGDVVGHPYFVIIASGEENQHLRRKSCDYEIHISLEAE
jgi:hypothetical protein